MQPFEISLRGLKPGKSVIEWHADGEFFREYGSEEIREADVRILCNVDFLERSLYVECELEGSVVVTCDRCLEDLTLPVKASFEAEDQTDLTQDIYDYVCLSLPLLKVHPEGECNEETIKYLKR